MTAAGASEAIKARLEFAVDAAREAGERTLGAFRSRRFGVETKRDGSVVTEVDRETEAWIRQQVGAHFGEDGFLGEEHGERQGTGPYRWVVDPIDGTTSFVHGVPLYGTLVAVERRLEAHRREIPGEAKERDYGWESVVGVIAMPALGEMVYAAADGGAWHVAAGHSEAQPARVSQTSELGDAVICTTSLDYFAKQGRQRAYETLAEACGMMRGWSDCYAHVLVATGRADAAVEPMISIWDVAAMPVIMAEAGGRYTDWEGRAGAQWKTGLSTNGLIHGAMLDVLRGARG